MKLIIQSIKDKIMWWVILIVCGAVYLFYKKFFYVDMSALDLNFEKSKTYDYGPEQYDVEWFKRKALEKKMEKEDKGGWELLLENGNHFNVAPHVILKTSSQELATYLMNTLQEAFKDMGYKSFYIYIKSTKGGIILKDTKHGIL